MLISSANEMLVKTKAVGICGSDFHLFRGGYPYTTNPLIFRLEASGMNEIPTSKVKRLVASGYMKRKPQIPCGRGYPC